ncbi:MAG TPA: type II secretion system protein [Dehalococcoidia bacterium]|jgi:prepilin-type N-terminal cleavage/methylation domain-containing protein|nr:type II secretion system protein [Dehalococcoidia bacterium]
MKISAEKGMTLVELLVAITITAVIVGGLSAAIYFIVATTERGSAEASALHNLQKAAYWISLDAQMAATTDIPDGGQAESITLSWIDSEGNSYTSSYSLSDSNLLRQYNSTVSTVARGISMVRFAISGNTLTFYLESTAAGRWPVKRSMTGQVYLRPETGG